MKLKIELSFKYFKNILYLYNNVLFLGQNAFMMSCTSFLSIVETEFNFL